jgi:hypothetical protein
MIHVFEQVNSEKKITMEAVQVEAKMRDLFGIDVAYHR